MHEQQRARHALVKAVRPLQTAPAILELRRRQSLAVAVGAGARDVRVDAQMEGLGVEDGGVAPRRPEFARQRVARLEGVPIEVAADGILGPVAGERVGQRREWRGAAPSRRLRFQIRRTCLKRRSRSSATSRSSRANAPSAGADAFVDALGISS